MLWLSSGRRIDGLWVGTYYGSNAEKVLRRVEEALALIKSCDPLRYRRILRDLDRVWVNLLPGGLAQFKNSIRACEIDERFVLADTSSPEMIAAAIVHEAAHARLWQCGISYDESIRDRVESICVRRELAFAKLLPNGQQVVEWAEACLATPSAAWTDTAFRERNLQGSIEVLRHLGTPRWLLRFLERRASSTKARTVEPTRLQYLAAPQPCARLTRRSARRATALWLYRGSRGGG
jgi:hypothetical protein